MSSSIFATDFYSSSDKPRRVSGLGSTSSETHLKQRTRLWSKALRSVRGQNQHLIRVFTHAEESELSR